MCLAIPGKVLRWVNTDPLLAVAEIEFGGITRRCHMACVPKARLGDYVLVHAGVAIAILDSDEAARVLEELASLPDEIEWPGGDEREATP
jgi:hydrogenase expression/formation protein HypC